MDNKFSFQEICVASKNYSWSLSNILRISRKGTSFDWEDLLILKIDNHIFWKVDLQFKKKMKSYLPFLLVEIKFWIWAFAVQCNDKDRAANKMQKTEMQSSFLEAAAKDLEAVTNNDASFKIQMSN